MKNQIDRAGQINRQETLAPRTRTRQNKRVPLVVSHHPSLPHLAALTSESLLVLHASHRLQQAIPEPPIVAYRRPKNLRNLLIIAELKSADNEPNQGSSPCGSKRCLTCRHIRTGETFDTDWSALPCTSYSNMQDQQHHLQ